MSYFGVPKMVHFVTSGRSGVYDESITLIDVRLRASRTAGCCLVSHLMLKNRAARLTKSTKNRGFRMLAGFRQNSGPERAGSVSHSNINYDCQRPYKKNDFF